MANGGWLERWERWRCEAWRPAAMFVLLQIVNGFWYLPQASFFPIFLQERIGLASSAIGAVIAGAQLSGMATALLSGALNARLGSKRVVVLGLALACVSGLAFTASSAPALAAILWIAGGVGLALATIGGASYLALLGARGGMGMIAAIYAVGMSVGGMIGNPVAGAIIEGYGFLCFGVFQTATIVISALLAGLFLVDLKDRSRASVLRSFGADALAIVRQRRIQILAGMRSFPTIFNAMIAVLIPLLLNELTGSKALVAVYGSTTLIVAAVSQLLVGRAADRFGARMPTLVSFAFLIVAGIGLTLTTQLVWGVFLFGVLGTTAIWALATMMYMWVADGVAPPARASAYGMLHAVWSLSSISGSLLAGGLVNVMPGLPFVLATLLSAGGLVLTRSFYRRTILGTPTGPS